MKESNVKTSEKSDGEAAVLEKIAAMSEPYRSVGERLHKLIMSTVPTLQPRVWYGMPGYAKTINSPVLCFFRSDKYMTFGLTDKANFTLEEGAPHHLLASSWFFTELDDATETKIADIVRDATS